MTVALADSMRPTDPRFFRACMLAMAGVLVSGFVIQLAAGRSSFHAPLIVHAHAVVFMSWVGIVSAQAWLGASGAIEVHRKLGRAAVGFGVLLLVLGPLVTIAAARTGRVPFFFQPQHFIFANSLTLFAAAALFAAAIALRKKTDWHARLQIGALTAILGPGIGRIVPMPLLIPYAFEIAAVIGLIAPAAGIVRDVRSGRGVHPAWLWSIGALIAALALARILAFSPIGAALYQAVIAGAPQALSDGLSYPPAPPH